MLSLDEILQKTNAKKIGPHQFLAKCPTHNDNNPSLSINTQSDKILYHCHAGCTYEEITSQINESLYLPTSPPEKKKSFNISDLPGKRIKDSSLITSYYKKHRNIINFRFSSSLFVREISKSKYAIEIPCYSYMFPEKQVGAHLVFIDEDGKNIINEKGKKIKKNYGDITKSIAQFGEKDNARRVHICEGNEDAAIIASIINEPVIPRFGTAGLTNFIPEERTEELLIWADNDEPGQKAAASAMEKLSKKFKVTIHTPKNKDWLDEEISKKGTILKKFENYKYKNWSKPKVVLKSLPVVKRITSNECNELLYNFAIEETAIAKSHPDMFICSAIVAISSLAARVYDIQPTRQDPGYKESPNLWGMIISPPGSRKSSAMKKGCFTLIGDSNRKLMAEERKNQKEFVASYKKLLKLQKNLEKQEGSKLPIESDIELLKKDVKELEETLEAKPLKYKTLIVSDITSGAFLQRASRTNENILFFQDELSGLLISLKNHFKSDLRPVFLQGWNGTGEYYKETKTDGIEFIKLLSVSILGSIQPTVISPILDEIFSGRNDDGFTQRFQFLVYPDFTDEIPSNGFYNQEYLHELQSAVESLLDYYSIITNQCKKTIILTDKALELSSKLCNFTFDDSLDEMSKQIIKSFTSKSPKLLYSIALIFEILENHENLENLNKISDNSLETSYRLCLKLFEYLRKFLFYKLYPEKTKSHLIINRIIAGDIYDQMKVRDLKRKEWRGLRTYDDINMALSELEAQNWLRITEVSSISGVGRKSDIIELNPYLSNTDIKNYIEG